MSGISPQPGPTPTLAPGAPPPQPGVDDVTPAPGARPTVLVADDDPGLRLLARCTMEAAGFDVIEAEGGQEALDQVHERTPDVLLCDVLMPDLDGYSVCEILRADGTRSDLPVVMLTSLDDTTSIDQAFAVGATDFICKPIHWPLLPHRLRYILRASNAVRDLHASEERYALAARGAKGGLWDWDVASGHLYLAPRWATMLGYAPDAVGRTIESWLSLVHEDDRTEVENLLWAHAHGESPHFESEHRILAADGEYRWVVSRGLGVRDGHGTFTRCAGSQIDITSRKRAEEKLQHDAFHDTLTGLPNRSLFLDRLSHCIERSSRLPESRFAVLFMDLNRFKTINDSLGHLVGDRLLVEVASRLRGTLRTGDTLARLGGDEFTVLLEDYADTRTVTRMAERIQDVLSAPLTLDDQTIVTTASIGIALSAKGYRRPEEMLRDADAAMYRAKRSGRGSYQIFDPEMHTSAVHALRVETELRQALDNQEFMLHYQPIVRLEDDRTVGFEALLRWNRPDGSQVTPGYFLDVANESRLIVPIGRWVLREACRQMSEWRRLAPHTADWYISVNLSGAELGQPDLRGYLAAVLESTGLPGSALKLEFTETSLIQNPEQAMEVMRELREIGIELSIDDFGTGHSSFNYLHSFPFAALKIDGTFVRGVDTDSERLELVRALIDLAHNLGLKVVVEGSDSEALVSTLRDLPCEFAQGYSLQAPMPSGDVEKLHAPD